LTDSVVSHKKIGTHIRTMSNFDGNPTKVLLRPCRITHSEVALDNCLRYGENVHFATHTISECSGHVTRHCRKHFVRVETSECLQEEPTAQNANHDSLFSISQRKHTATLSS
jgi:hypothetical protein